MMEGGLGRDLGGEVDNVDVGLVAGVDLEVDFQAEVVVGDEGHRLALEVEVVVEDAVHRLVDQCLVMMMVRLHDVRHPDLVAVVAEVVPYAEGVEGLGQCPDRRLGSASDRAMLRLH